jgi:hypothetical protein
MDTYNSTSADLRPPIEVCKQVMVLGKSLTNEGTKRQL